MRRFVRLESPSDSACCLCQDSPETISAGIAGFKRFVAHSDKMVAFVSPAYFDRLWVRHHLRL